MFMRVDQLQVELPAPKAADVGRFGVAEVC